MMGYDAECRSPPTDMGCKFMKCRETAINYIPFYSFELDVCGYMSILKCNEMNERTFARKMHSGIKYFSRAGRHFLIKIIITIISF